MFYRNPSAGMLLTEKEVNMDLILRSDLFHFGSISLISEPCRSAHLAALRAAKAACCVRNPNTFGSQLERPHVISNGPPNMTFNILFFVLVSDDEEAFLTDVDPHDEEKFFCDFSADRTFLYLFITKSSWIYAVKPVDTTGAGDAFVGFFLLSIAKDRSIFN
ncbi:fructokinase-2-like [Dendrobium catenatum]|uniref:fructokinase-2-like n=1 Tax=Dendrobium catenatum TaxID=906689 RepID=UPI0009F565BC|nr:fructokinase-2-like [Dendrobium catenatum]